MKISPVSSPQPYEGPPKSIMIGSEPPPIPHSPPTDSPDEESDLEFYEDFIPPDKIKRRYTKEDANSLVGGLSLEHHKSDPRKTTEEQDRNFELYKVFSFSLPFGGLTLFRSGFKLPFSHKNDPEIEALRLRLERKESVDTMEEAKFFARVRGTDDSRLRAVKHSIRENISDFFPDFIKKEKPWEAVYHDIDGPIVVMGGYRGSILRDTNTGKRVWIPLKAGFNLKKINLLLGPTKEDEARAGETIYADGVLKNVGPIDICKKLIRKLGANPKTTVREFGYDWRLSLDVTSGHLVKFLEDLRAETGKPALVIAHSMGGLVAHGAMQKLPELFRGIVYTGVPSECLNILGPIRYGDSVMLSDKILTFETNFMMRSSYSFLPLSGRVFSNKETGEFYDLDYFHPDTWVKYNLNPLVSERRKLQEERKEDSTPDSPQTSLDTLVNEENLSAWTSSPMSSIGSPMSAIGSRIMQYKPGINRKSKPALLTNQQMQKRYHLLKSPQALNKLPSCPQSPVEEDPLTDYNFSFTFTEAYDYLSETLKLTKEYMLGLNYRPELKNKYPPLAVVYGNTVPSVRGSNVGSEDDIKNGDYYEFFYGRGDGVVHLRWLMPEQKGFELYNHRTGEGQIVGKFESDGGHVNLMTDFKVMGKALNSIVEAEKHWKREL